MLCASCCAPRLFSKYYFWQDSIPMFWSLFARSCSDSNNNNNDNNNNNNTAEWFDQSEVLTFTHQFIRPGPLSYHHQTQIFLKPNT